MSFTRRQYAVDVLRAAGITSPSEEVIQWMTAWTVAETAPGEAPGGGAHNNLYNTTQFEPGAWPFNTFGNNLHVWNYPSYTEGVNTNALEMNNGFYPALMKALRSNDLAALGYYNGIPSGAVQRNLGTWGTGATWVRNLKALAQYGSQTFNYSSPPPGTPPPPSPPGGGSSFGPLDQLQEALVLSLTVSPFVAFPLVFGNGVSLPGTAPENTTLPPSVNPPTGTLPPVGSSGFGSGGLPPRYDAPPRPRLVVRAPIPRALQRK